jgi:sugar phosphate isomerase/epimerase
MSVIAPENLYFSTICLSHELGYKNALAEYEKLGIEGVELGYCPDGEALPGSIPSSGQFRVTCHNYCLPAEPNFINLASDDDEIREWSVSYINEAIDFCAQHGVELYTFHGGFRVDPNQELEFNGEPTSYEEAFETFVSEVWKVGTYAEQRGVTLGIENNVIEDSHLRDGENEILMFCRAAEFTRLFDALDVPNVGLLLDIGHLRVAANTLEFDPAVFGDLEEHLVAVHLHDNDGKTDLHLPSTPDRWGMEFYTKHLSDVSVPVVVESHFDSPESLVETREKLLQ